MSQLEDELAQKRLSIQRIEHKMKQIENAVENKVKQFENAIKNMERNKQ